MGGPELRGRAPHVEPPVDATAPTSPDLSDYLGLLRRQWWVVLLVTLFVVGTAYGVTQAMPREYESATSVLVQPAGQDTNVVGGRTKGDDQPRHRGAAGPVDRGRGRRGEPAARHRARRTTSPAASPSRCRRTPSVLVITYTAPAPGPRPGRLARVRRGVPAQPRGDRAGRHRRPDRRARPQGQAAQRDARRRSTRRLARPVRVEPAAADPGEPAHHRAEPAQQRSARSSTTSPRRPSAAARSSATPGCPTAPTKPEPHAQPRHRRDARPAARLRASRSPGSGSTGGCGSAADVERDAPASPVLAALDRRRPRRASTRCSRRTRPGGRIFNRLRNEVLASLRPRATGSIVVTGASRGAAATLVAANLAAALARTGGEVVLVGAHLPDSARRTRRRWPGCSASPPTPGPVRRARRQGRAGRGAAARAARTRRCT